MNHLGRRAHTVPDGREDKTVACGTGACATAAAAACEQSMVERVTVRLRGGDLFVRAGARTFELAGPAEYVFEGTT
jgi:diaminopimelate epimerase